MCKVFIAAALSLAVSTAGGACAKEIQDPRSGEVDFLDPKSVTASIFYAAETGRADHLRGLCDPTGSSDEDTRRICAMRPGAPGWESFRRNFARARLNGEPRVAGDRAELNFLFGPSGDESETMALVRRGGRWYLASF